MNPKFMNYLFNFLLFLSIFLMSITEPFLEWLMTEGPEYGILALIALGVWKFYQWLNSKLNTITKQSDRQETQMTFVLPAVENLTTSQRRVESSLTQLDTRVHWLETTVQQIDVRLSKIETSVQQIDIRLSKLEVKADNLSEKIENMDKKIDKIEDKIDRGFEEQRQFNIKLLTILTGNKMAIN